MTAPRNDLEKGIQAALESPDFETFTLDDTQNPSMKLLTEDEEETETETHLYADLLHSDWRVKLHIAFLISILLLLLGIIIWLGITHA